MAGLIAANMLRRFNPVVWEAQPTLPNNHDALLRFRTDSVSRATGVPFRKVNVQKAICYGRKLYEQTNLKFNNMYAQKVTGKAEARSILSLSSCDRYIAPPDFIRQMANSCLIEYGQEFDSSRLDKVGEGEPVISTMPMPTLMRMLEWQDVPNFPYKPIHTLSTTLDCVDLYQTLYYPGEEKWYRASITGNSLMIEYQGTWVLGAETIVEVLQDFGLHCNFRQTKLTTQKYGKISPVDNNLRKQFICYATDEFKVYSLGRFGTWRQLLLDDMVHDVQVIEGFITDRDSYRRKLSVAAVA